jgi:hypothetical protein
MIITPGVSIGRTFAHSLATNLSLIVPIALAGLAVAYAVQWSSLAERRKAFLRKLLAHDGLDNKTVLNFMQAKDPIELARSLLFGQTEGPPDASHVALRKALAEAL